MKAPRPALLLLFACLLLRLSSGQCPILVSAPQEIGRIQSLDITEASGLAASWRNPGVFWTHNDGSHEKIFALSTSGELLASFKLTKTTDDVEDIGVGPGPIDGVSFLYIGDIGSNDSTRDEVKIFRVAEPQVSGGAGSVDFEGVEVFHLKYPAGKFDAEALLVDPVARELYIATKETDGAHLFRASINALVSGERTTLEAVAELAFAKVSGGAISRDGSLIALRREDEAHLWRRGPGESVVDALRRSPEPLLVVGPPTEPNGEGITFLTDMTGYVTVSEGNQQPLYLFRFTSGGNTTPSFVGAPQVANNRITMEISSCAGTVVSVQRSSDLGQWEVAQTFTAGTTPFVFAEDLVPGQRFYRLVTQ